MAYQLHLNPQQTAALKIAISFWERKEVKDQAIQILRFWNTMDTYECHLKWNEFTKKILNEWKDDSLPQKLEAESIYIIKIIGKTIFNWYQNNKLKYTTGEELKYDLDEIKWTPYGTVDEVETFKSYWLDHPNLYITNVYIFACHHAIEEHIVNWWNERPRNVHDIIPKDNDYCTFDKHILAYWEHRRDRNLHNLMEYLQETANNFSTKDRRVFDIIYDLNRSIEENMLRLTVYQGYFSATKYFWEKLTEVERNYSVVKCARIAVICYYDKHQYERTADYMRSQYVEICIFLMNQMSNNQKKPFFNIMMKLDVSQYVGNKIFFNGMIRSDGPHDVSNVDVKDVILEMLLSTWPWRELFIPVLKDMMQYQDDDKNMEYRFVYVITKKMLAYHKLGDLMEFGKYQCLLHEAWIITPASLKQKIEQMNTFHIIFNLIIMWDLDSLNLIVNDQAIPASYRDQFIGLRLLRCRKLLEEDKFEEVDQFMEKILRSKEEKTQFKKEANILRDLMRKGKFHLANKMLDWQSSTPVERLILKNNINHTELCDKFIREDDYELLNKFLDWKFNTEEEKRKWKDHFKNNPISIEVICDKWKRCNGNINSAKEKCSQFLHWLFESEEEITLFKKGIVVNFESYDSNMIDFANLKRVGVLDDFISWCLLDDENIQLAQRMIQAVV